MNKNIINHGKVLEKLLIEREIGKSQFCSMMGITPSNYKYYFGKERFDNKYLEKINELLGVDINQPDADAPVPIRIGDVANTSDGIYASKDLYERLLAEKERVIQMLQPVSSLMDRIGNLEKEVLDLKRSLGK